MVQEMTNLPRKSTKTINFGICYGMGVDKLARGLKIERHEAEEFLEIYHAKVPFVSELFKKASHMAEMQGDIYTLLRRRRRWNLWGKKFMKAAEREDFRPLTQEEALKRFGSRGAARAFTHKALNALLQGGAADLMKLAMVQIWESGLAEACTVNLTVHDELNGSIPDTAEAREALQELTHIMQTCYELRVPLIAEGAEGNNWYEAK
jgi:DNA polymerase-1